MAISEKDKVAMYSKNMSTINHWLSRQGFLRYDSLFWSHCSGRTYLHFVESEIVAIVEWYCVVRDNVEYFVPVFKFMGEFEHWNGNQLNFWIGLNIARVFNDSAKDL